MKKKIILVTNDDGVTAPGLKALVSVAKEFGKVYVVAPDSPQSGKGHAITLGEPLRLKKVKLFDKMKNVEAYKCSGTPAIYSGTMSAAMEASLEGIDSIGFSLTDFSWNADFEPSKKYVRKIIKKVLEKGLPDCKLLNVNIPAISKKKIKGIKVCHQADAHWVEEFQEGKDPMGRSYYWLTGKFVNKDKDPNSDVKAVEKGYVSVVPAGHDLTKYESMKPLRFYSFLSSDTKR